MFFTLWVDWVYFNSSVGIVLMCIGNSTSVNELSVQSKQKQKSNSFSDTMLIGFDNGIVKQHIHQENNQSYIVW